MKNDSHGKFAKIIPLVKFSLFLMVVFFIIYFINDHLNEFRKLNDIRFITLFWLSILFFLIQILYSYQYGLLLKSFGINLRLISLFKLVSLRSYYNYLPLNAGTVHNAVFLKKTKNLPITSFVSLIAGSTFLMIFSYGIIGIIVIIYHYYKNNIFSLDLFIVLMVILIFCLLLLLVPIPEIQSEKRILKWLSNIQTGLNSIKENKSELVKIICLHIIVLIIFSLRYWFIFHDLNVPIHLAEIIIITIIASVLRLNSIIPGNLGIRESITGYVVFTFGSTFTIGLMIGIIDRIILMFWTFVFGFIFSFILKNRISISKK